MSWLRYNGMESIDSDACGTVLIYDSDTSDFVEFNNATSTRRWRSRPAGVECLLVMFRIPRHPGEKRSFSVELQGICIEALGFSRVTG